MARVTVTMSEVLWQRARHAASSNGESLSRFVVESLKRKLDQGLMESQPDVGSSAGSFDASLRNDLKSPKRGKESDGA